MNPLHQFPRVRRALYFVQWLVTGVQTVGSAYFAFDLGDVADWPRMFLASLAVTPVLWTYLGVTAQSNVAVSGNPAPVHEDDDPDEGLVFGDPHDWEGSE